MICEAGTEEENGSSKHSEERNISTFGERLSLIHESKKKNGPLPFKERPKS